MDFSSAAISGRRTIELIECLNSTLRCFESYWDRKLKQLKQYKHASSRTGGICRTQHTMLPRIDSLSDSTTPTPDFTRFTQSAEVRVFFYGNHRVCATYLS